MEARKHTLAPRALDLGPKATARAKSEHIQRRQESKAVVGKFYRPIKKALTIRLDADVLAWLKEQGKGYQTRINLLLRNAMEKARENQRR